MLVWARIPVIAVALLVAGVLLGGALNAAAVTPTPTPAGRPTPVVAAWQPNVAYAVNALVTYGGSTYKCLQAHTSQVGWEPPHTPALWQVHTGTTPTPTA